MKIRTHKDAWDELITRLEDDENGSESTFEIIKRIESDADVELVYCFSRARLLKSIANVQFQSAHDKDLVYRAIGLAEEEYAFYAEPILWHWKYYHRVKPSESGKYFVTWRCYAENGITTKTEKLYYDCETDAWNYPKGSENVLKQEVFSWAERYNGSYD